MAPNFAFNLNFGRNFQITAKINNLQAKIVPKVFIFANFCRLRVTRFNESQATDRAGMTGASRHNHGEDWGNTLVESIALQKKYAGYKRVTP